MWLQAAGLPLMVVALAQQAEASRASSWSRSIVERKTPWVAPFSVAAIFGWGSEVRGALGRHTTERGVDIPEMEVEIEEKEALDFIESHYPGISDIGNYEGSSWLVFRLQYYGVLPLLLDLEIEPLDQTVTAGGEVPFHAIGHFTDGTRDITGDVIWTSSLTKRWCG